MNKKIFLAIICPILAVIIAVAGVWTLWPEKIPYNLATNGNSQESESKAEEKPESVFAHIPKEQVFSSAEMLCDWAINVYDPKVILEYSDAVVRAKILNADKALFFGEDGTIPSIPLNIQILEVMSGDIKDTKTIYFPGGAVTAEDYLKQCPESGTKMGLNDLSKEERQKMYLGFPTEMDCDLKTNTEYIFLLSWNEILGEYFVTSGAFNTFTKDMKNVNTNNVLRSTIAGQAKTSK